MGSQPDHFLSPSAGGTGMGSGGRGSYIDIVARVAGTASSTSETTYPQAHSLFLIFPDVIAQMFTHRGFHHSSLLLPREALMAGLYRAIQRPPFLSILL